MARKILIIFALIIAVFPYLAFSDFTDHFVTTIFALLIALALLFSRKPKTIPNKGADTPKVDMPSPFSVKMQDMTVVHKDEVETKPKIFNQTEKEEVVKISHDSSDGFVVNNSGATATETSTIVKPVRRRVAPKVQEVAPVIKSEEVVIEERVEVAPRRRSSRKIVNSILANEESVPPADIPTRFE